MVQTAISASNTLFWTSARLLQAFTFTAKDWDKPEDMRVAVPGSALQASSSTELTVDRLLGKYRRIGLPPDVIVSNCSNIEW
jgi:hypothetical protein